MMMKSTFAIRLSFTIVLSLGQYGCVTTRKSNYKVSNSSHDPSKGTTMQSEAALQIETGRVSGVLKYEGTDSPVVDTTVSLFKVTVKGIEDGIATISLQFNSDGEVAEKFSTKTDSTGTFLFDNIPKETHYYLSNIDYIGETVFVIISKNDKVKNLGTVYLKQSKPEREKP